MSINSFDNYHLTWKPDLEPGPSPIYLSLAASLEKDILSGRLPRGVRLPPQRELADWLGIDFTTVTRAYNVCKEKSLIYGITGRGTFVSPAPFDTVSPSFADEKVVDLSEMTGFPTVSGGIAEAIRRVASGGYLDRIFGYSDPIGSPHQLAAGRHLLEMCNAGSASSEIAIFAGAQNAIAVALFSLFAPGEAIAVDHYTYSNLIGGARMAHLKLVPVAGDKGGMDAVALDRMAAKFRIKGLFVMPNAANPTGITLSEKRRDEIAAVARRRSLIIIEDDISPFAPSTARKSFLERLPDRTIYIAAYTAMFAPGFRITYAAFPEKFRRSLIKGLSFLNIKAGSLDAEVVSELILSGAALEIMRGKRQAAKEANAIFDKVFPRESLDHEAKKMGLYPFFRRLNLPPSDLSGPEAEDFFLAHGIKVMHSYRFAVEKAVQRDFLRISISSMRSARQLKSALAVLSGVMKSFPSISR